MAWAGSRPRHTEEALRPLFLLRRKALHACTSISAAPKPRSRGPSPGSHGTPGRWGAQRASDERPKLGCFLVGEDCSFHLAWPWHSRGHLSLDPPQTEPRRTGQATGAALSTPSKVLESLSPGSSGLGDECPQPLGRTTLRCRRPSRVSWSKITPPACLLPYPFMVSHTRPCLSIRFWRT